MSKNSSSTPLDSWSLVETGLDLLLSTADAYVNQPALQQARSSALQHVCSALQHLATNQSRPAGGTSVITVLRCFVKVMQLLGRLLEARKHAEDWWQQDYSSMVCSMLAAATAFLKHPSMHANHVAAGKMAQKLLADTGLLTHVAKAQQEVAQLLVAQATQQQQQQQQPGNRQGQALLLQVAQQLLLWWVGAQELWRQDMERVQRNLSTAAPAAAAEATAEAFYAHHMSAVELAAAVATAAGHDCTTDQFLVLAQVAHVVAGFPWPEDLPEAAAQAATAQYYSTAYLQLSLAMLLVHTFSLQAACAAAQHTAAVGPGATTGSSSSSSSSLAGAVLAHAGRQQQQQLAASTVALWQLLGWKSSSLQAFSDAVQANADMKPLLLAAAEPVGGSNNSGVPLSPNMALLLGVLSCTMQELSFTLHTTVKPRGLYEDEWRRQGMPVAEEQLTRQQQQVCWGLPELLLRTALLAEQPWVTAMAAEAAGMALLCWHAPGMAMPAAAVQPSAGLLPALLNCWRALLHELLLQPPSSCQPDADTQQQQQQYCGLLFQAAATACLLPKDSHCLGCQAEAQQLLAADMCSCMSGSSRYDRSSSTFFSRSSSRISHSSSRLSCVSLDCERLQAIDNLLMCLGAIKAPGQCYLDKLDSVLLLLEVLARRILCCHIICSSSISSQASSTAGDLCLTFCSMLSNWQSGFAGYGIADALVAAAVRRPQLQPQLMALAASLQKLACSGSVPAGVYWHDVTLLQPVIAMAHGARRIIHAFSKAGLPAAMGRDLRAWRHMLAPWVLLIGRCYWVLGCWLQQWQREALRELQELQQQPGSDGSSSDDSSIGSYIGASMQAEGLVQVFHSFYRLQLRSQSKWAWRRSLWECGSESSNAVDYSDSSSDSMHEWGVDGSTAASLAADWQQWQAATAGQQPVPAYGSLAAEFGELTWETSDVAETCSELAQLTQQHLEALNSGQLPSKSSSSNTTSSGGSGGSDSGGSDSGGSDSGGSSSSSDTFGLGPWLAAQQAVLEATTIEATMQACVGFEGFSQLGSQLQQVGAALCAKLPVPWLCNNPGCTSMAGASELQLVGGKGCVCGGCRVARYCGRSCQQGHWALHKPICRELASAAAAAAATGLDEGAGAAMQQPAAGVVAAAAGEQVSQEAGVLPAEPEVGRAEGC